jgi:hypothetical protein
VERGPKYPIDLISIGIVAEDGREYYAQSCEFEPAKASAWVKGNVILHLDTCPYTLPSRATVWSTFIRAFHLHKQGQCVPTMNEPAHYRCPWRTRAQIKTEILAFMDREEYGLPELWAYYGSYDHVAFCQLFGTMMDLPNGFPMYTRDIKQWCDSLGNPQLPEQGNGEHNALSDARHNQVMWTFLDAYERKRSKL